jgi:hypothetical protein
MSQFHEDAGKGGEWPAIRDELPLTGGQLRESAFTFPKGEGFVP